MQTDTCECFIRYLDCLIKDQGLLTIFTNHQSEILCIKQKLKIDMVGERTATNYIQIS